MDDAAQTRELLEYIRHEVICRPGLTITADSPLVSSGLIDSFALIDLLLKLEEVTSLRIPAGKVQPKDMDTIDLMLATAKRVGRPKA